MSVCSPISTISQYFNNNLGISDASSCMSSLFKFSNKIENILGSSGQKVTQKQPKMTVCCCENIWKFNSRTTDPISTKLARYVYHLNTFHFWKLMVSIKGQQRAHPKKSMKICQEFIKVLTLISLKNSLQNAIRLGFFPLSSIIYLQQMYLEWGGGGLYLQCASATPKSAGNTIQMYETSWHW